MRYCLAPSEIPGVGKREYELAGAFVEDVLYADLVRKHGLVYGDVFKDDHNPAAYIFFLASRNRGFDEARQKEFLTRLKQEKLYRIPDFLLHTAAERGFYEIKPDSRSGRRAGEQKVGYLRAAYSAFDLPYVAGRLFQPGEFAVASAGKDVRLTLNTRLVDDGLILYRFCLEVRISLEAVALAALMAFLIEKILEGRGRGVFRPIDLKQVLQHVNLPELAKAARRVLPAAARVATWRHFWRAVGKRFALRGGTMLALSSADGPLPVGELVSLGIGVFTVFEIVSEYESLWRDAGELARQGA